MPRPGEASKAFFREIFAGDPDIQIKPMFGNVAGFVNGNMFSCLFGDDFCVRLPEAERAELLSVEGTSVLEPMPGRPMKEYVVVPPAWRDDPVRVRDWAARSLEWARGLPPKEPGGRKRARTT